MHVFLMLTIFCISMNIGDVHGVKSSGKEYIIAFMENEVKEKPLEIFITPDSSVAKVDVSSPKCQNGSVKDSFELQLGRTKRITLNVTTFMITKTSRSFCSIYVSATEPIVIYGLNKEPFSTDGFLQLPINALGKQYYVVSREGQGDHSEFLIVGTYDSTTITVTLSESIQKYTVTFEGKKYAKGDVMVFQIQRFECVQIQSYGDLTGSKIVADKDIGVYGGHDLVTIGPGAADHLSEMLPSVDKWGKTFVTIPFPERKVGDNFRFVSSEDNTTIYLTGECKDKIFLSKAGEYHERIINSDAHCFIEADKAILTVQFSRGNGDTDDPGDPAMMLIQSLQSYISVVSFMCPKGAGVNYTNYLMITIESNYKDGLSLDGQKITQPFVDIKGLPYSATSLRVSEGAHVLKHEMPNVGFACYLYGRGEYESYAFPVGMRMASINTQCHQSSMEPGDDIDNDCDGRIDEERCYDTTDEDNDGKLDEDCAFSNQDSHRTFSVLKEKHESEFQEKQSLKPIWVTYMEAAALASVLIVITGAMGCCCRHCCLLMKKRNSSEEENYIKPWKQGRQSPMKRPPRKNS